MINPYILLTCFGLGEGSKFQLVGGPQKIEFYKQKEQFDPNFLETCVDFEVAHLCMIRRLWYRSIQP